MRSPSCRIAAAYLVAGGAWMLIPQDLTWQIFDTILPVTPEASKWLPFVILSCLLMQRILCHQMGRVTKSTGYARRMQYFVRGLIDHCPLPIVVKDENGVIVLANRPANDRHLPPGESMVGKTIRNILPADIAERLAANDRVVMKTGIATEEDIECIVKGKPQTSRIVKFPIFDDQATVKGIGTFSIDLTYARLIEGKLQQRAVIDDLTGLPNREFVSREIPKLIGQAQAAGRTLTLILVAFDGLKRIEATLGQETADDALIAAVERLKEVVGPSALIAYLRGWDVLVVYPEEPGLRRPTNIARAIAAAFTAPIALAQNMIFPGPRIGLAAYPKDGMTADALLKNVRTALSDWTVEDAESFTRCIPDMERAAHRRLIIETQLRTALERNEFLLNYQAQMDANGEHLVGAEALLRWRNPVLGFVSPVEFIPIAEESGLITAIDRWVLETACKEAQTWTAHGGGHIRIAVNVTANQFQNQDFVRFVSKVLRDTGLAPRRLEVELTERIFLKDGGDVHENVKWLSKLNVHLAIDDFGTGYSSLKTLKSFPFDVVKIDKSFVDDIVSDAGDLAITKTIVGMSKNLGLKVVAEGVETEMQRDLLRGLGVDFLQGYLYSRPISALEFRQFIRRHNPPVKKCG